MSTRLEIGRVGRVGSIVFEADDVLGVEARRDGVNAVTLRIRHRREYLEDELSSFRWNAGYQDLSLTLSQRQAREAVEQLRSEQSGFCNGEDDAGCYDFGKVEKAPAGCLRCLMLEACAKARQGDHRKVQPAAVERPRFGAIAAVWLLILALWFVCWMWATTGEELQKELDGCRRAKVSPAVRR